MNTSTLSYAKHLALAEKACAFLTKSTDPLHAVQQSIVKLQAAGFQALTKEVKAGGKYYYAVHHSTLVAFAVGEQYQAGTGGFLILGGTHSTVKYSLMLVSNDMPRVKPFSFLATTYTQKLKSLLSFVLILIILLPICAPISFT
jgi:hypothetical protein